MKRIIIFAMIILLSFTAAFAQDMPADPEILFLDILAVMLNENEMTDISGGDVQVVVVLNSDYSGKATITLTPRYQNGKLATVDKSTFTVAVHNRITGTTAEDKRRNDFYITDRFPEGTHTITGVSKAPMAYGNSSNEWVTTDATRLVMASATRQDGKLTGTTYEREDSGYFWHNNENYDFSVSKSYGCIVSTKADMDKVAAAIKADQNPKSSKTIKVVQPEKTTPTRVAISKPAQAKPVARKTKPLMP